MPQGFKVSKPDQTTPAQYEPQIHSLRIMCRQRSNRRAAYRIYRHQLSHRLCGGSPALVGSAHFNSTYKEKISGSCFNTPPTTQEVSSLPPPSLSSSMSFFNKVLNTKPLEALTQHPIAQQAQNKGMNVFKDVAQLTHKGAKHARDEVIGPCFRCPC